MFGKKTVSDSMLDAVKSVVSGVQEDATGAQLETGYPAIVTGKQHSESRDIRRNNYGYITKSTS